MCGGGRLTRTRARQEIKGAGVVISSILAGFYTDRVSCVALINTNTQAKTARPGGMTEVEKLNNKTARGRGVDPGTREGEVPGRGRRVIPGRRVVPG